MSLAEQVDAATDAIEKLDHELAAVGKHDEVFVRLAAWMGPYTAAVIVTKCDLRRYTSARQLEKVRQSSREEQRRGQGPALDHKARAGRFMFALRMIYRSPSSARKDGAATGAGQAARRCRSDAQLVRAILPVASGAPFDEGKLFDLRLEATPPVRSGHVRVAHSAPLDRPRKQARWRERRCRFHIDFPLRRRLAR